MNNNHNNDIHASTYNPFPKSRGCTNAWSAVRRPPRSWRGSKSGCAAPNQNYRPGDGSCCERRRPRWLAGTGRHNAELDRIWRPTEGDVRLNHVHNTRIPPLQSFSEVQSLHKRMVCGEAPAALVGSRSGCAAPSQNYRPQPTYTSALGREGRATTKVVAPRAGGRRWPGCEWREPMHAPEHSASPKRVRCRMCRVALGRATRSDGVPIGRTAMCGMNIAGPYRRCPAHSKPTYLRPSSALCQTCSGPIALRSAAARSPGATRKASAERASEEAPP